MRIQSRGQRSGPHSDLSITGSATPSSSGFDLCGDAGELRGRAASLGVRSGRGFTLLEILLALSLVGLVLVSLNTFVFSMGELWGKNGDLRLFDQHVRAVTRFLDHELRTAGLPPTGSAGAASIVGQEIRPKSGSTENLLTFELTGGNRLLSWPDRPLPEVICSLQVRPREGLWLLWHSRLETRFDDDPPRETLITPLVTGLSYDYYDPDFKNWKNEPQLRHDANNQLVTPQRVRLQFAYQKLTRETTIILPSAPEGLPNF
jgi:prepilin-type N-terminal cleavage/methylation domain-containing protein